MRLLTWVLMATFGFSTWAATPYKLSLPEKKNSYLTDGVFTGGEAGAGSTLLAVRRQYSDKIKVERVVVEMGDKEGKRSSRLGYFQASVDAAHNRVELDLAQLRMSSVTEPQLREIFKKSPYVSSLDFTLDPEDKAGTLVLNLKRPMRLEVFQLVARGKPSRVVMDLTPSSVTQVHVRK